jgi:hypothetical protein
MGLEREISIKFLLKQITVWVLIVAFNFSIAGKIITIFNFYKNQNFIENYLCVQKNKKNNCCKGQCQLTKALNKLSEFQPNPKGSEKPIHSIVIFETDWIITEIEEFDSNYCQENFTIKSKDKPLIIESIYLKSIDHPPQFVC